MGLVVEEGGGGVVRGGGMRKRSPTRSKIIKDLQSETTAVSVGSHYSLHVTA